MNNSKEAACIICGQEHDRSYLEPAAGSNDHDKNKVRWRIYLPLVIPVVFISVFLFTPNYMGRPRQSPERAAIGNLKTIGQAEASFYLDNGRYGTFDDLVAAQELTAEWKEAAVRQCYRFTIKLYRNSAAISATPEEYRNDTRMSFQLYVDPDAFAVHGADRLGEKATRLDPIVKF